MTKTIITSALSTLVCGAALAADKPAAKPAAPVAPAAAPAGGSAQPMPMPTPSPELAAFLTPFEGNWKCDTRWPAGSMGPGSPEMNVKAAVKIRKMFGGMSWQGEYKVLKSKGFPGMTGYFTMSYDPGSKQVINVWYDSMGGAGMQAGPITGQSVTFTGDSYGMGMKFKAREVMELKGPKEAYHKYEMDMGKGFVMLSEDTCKK
jgi:hypothetical protein